ncbi:uncharacterized protein LOC126841666 isoform X2 [Adelges cooleyi]|uniref:uncharacterized protein LOC126841666 isoform X2 n=1 Tax=Adelges cooleyi TaxID=133065 RepID=UPI00217F9D6F|nr:uncharacterized protein LOC126841666 isoform X2 [Adelges cooleyi]
MIAADPETAPRLRQQQQRDDGHPETVDPMPSPTHPHDDRPYPVAASVYVLIDDEKLMGTDMRVMWFLKRLGCVLKVDVDQADQELSSELCKIVSFVPRDDANTTAAAVTNRVDRSNGPNDNHRFFTMDSLTRVYYLTSVYTMVYCLDMSPSNCSVDIQRGHVMLDEMIVALQRSIQGFIRPFIIPGSHEILFEPQVYVTVIVHTPFYTSLAQQVLVQGWRVNNHNFSEFIKMISCEMTRLENAVAQSNTVSWKNTNSDDENMSSSSDDDFYDANDPGREDRNQNGHTSVGATSRSRRNNLVSNAEKNMKITTMTNSNSPDSGFINTLRYGMLAVRLLPRSSISNLIVITDGMITLADIQVLDSVLNQLRCIGVACSFMHVSSQFHPHSCHGLVPYSELMQLIATATMGTYLNTFPDTDDDSTVNYYHEKFVLWTFRKGDDIASSNAMSSNNTSNLSCTPPRVRHGEWTVKNSNFYGNRQTQLLTKRQINDHMQAHLDNVVCCRMREGFIIEDIQFRDAGSSSTNSKLQLKFVLPWTNHIYIEYDLTVKWPPPSCSLAGPVMSQGSTTVQSPPASITQSTHIPIPSQSDSCLNIHYVILVKGPYEFLRDITSSRSKKSHNQNQAQSFQQRQYQLSSSSSSVTFPPFSTTITSATVQLADNGTPIANRGIVNSTVTSNYRQALITRFWSTMRSIGQTDLLVKHLETYSPSTGHLVDYNSSSQTRQYEQQILDNQQGQRGDPLNISPSSPNSSSKTDANKFLANTVVAAATIANLSPTGIPNRSPLRSGMPLFYHLPTTTTTSALKQQLQVKLNDQQQNYTDHQHQQYADFWKPVCTLDPDAQWPRWFSTYRIGGGVLLLRHDRPLPRWLHVANTVNGRYQTLTCRKAAESLFAMLKQWCTFVLIDDHSYVKCLNRNETYTSNVSFCIARVTLRPPCCCCVVLHVAFQSCVPATVHHKIVDDLKKRVQQLDSTMTTASSVLTTTTSKNDDSGSNGEHRHLHARRKSVISKIVLKKNKRPKKYVRILDKPLEKILIRYERMPSQFTTVIFPDGTQPNSIINASPVTTNFHFPNPTANSGRQQLNQRGISDGRLSTTPTTTTTLSRYLYHRRWIWSSGHSQHNNSSTSQQQQQQQQLARTLSILTKIRLREGFRFAHSSAGIINMVLQVDMTEASSLDKNKSSETNTTTSHCVIQYVLFPPHIISKHQPLDHDADDVNDGSKARLNDDNMYSSEDEDQRPEKYKRQEKNINVETTNGGHSSIEDDYQLITECWIEPQHGSVVVSGDKNNEYMSGLMYEQLADAMWLVDADCISSLFTFQHMQHMCIDSGVSVSSSGYDSHQRRRDKKNKISIDGGRIYKLPFDFSLVNLLPKCRRHSSITFNLFSTYSAIDGNKLNAMLERAFYAELRTINDRSFDVSGADGLQGAAAKPADAAKKDRHDENGQCYVKRLNNTRLILTVTPSCGKSPEKRFEFPENTDWQPACRLRANTWHYCNRAGGIQSCPPRPPDRYPSREAFPSSSSSVQYYRAMSVGSKPASHSNDMSWARFRLERNFCPSTIMDSQCFDAGGGDEPADDEPPPDFAPTMAVVVYDCRRLAVERALVSKNVSPPGDDPVAMPDNNGSSDESRCSSSTPTSDEDEDGDTAATTANYAAAAAADPMVTSQKDETILDRYLVKIQQAYDRCLVTTVFRALHLGLDVRYLDVQCAVDRCQHQMMTFDITDYIKVVCGHFKNNTSFNSCPEENKTLKLHHDMIRSKFAATLRRHMLQSVSSHPDYYFYCCTAKNKFDQEENYNNDNQSSSESIVNQGPDNTGTNEMSKQCLHTEVSEDPTPLFVHLVCSVKTDTMTKSRSVRSLPTCILELMDKDNDDEPFDLADIDFKNVRVSLDVYCLILANPDEDDDEDDDDSGSKDKMSNTDPTQLANHGTSYAPLQKSNESHNKPLLSSLPVRYARGLAAFIAEVEWCMRDEMAAGLLEDSTVTPETLDKVIQHVSNSSSSSSNGHQEIPVYFVEPPLGSSNYNSISLFVQQLDQMDIVLDQDNGGGLYALAKSSNDTFYVVKKKFTSNTSTDSTISDDDSHAAMGSDSEDCLTKAEQSRPSLPNFWIILKIQSNQSEQNNSLTVMLYFHCRFTELDVRGRYAAVREDVRQHIYRAATVVNQTLLLCRLHDTRMCDPILEPITENHVNSDDDDTSNCDADKKTNHFTFGQFRCPVVWTAKFMLHPRLQHSSSMLLLGVQVLHSVLDKLSVRNRRNMFVYREESSGSVFYLRLYENTLQQHIQNQKNLLLDTVQSDSDDEDSISRCSSATSTTATIASSINPPSYNPHSLRKPSDDINYMDTRSNQTLGSRSLAGNWADADSKDVEYLTLKVHGISPVGTEIRVDLVEVLQNRLNDAVLEVLTTMLYRNPVCRLYPDDVRFVQPLDNPADNVIKFSLPVDIRIKKSLVHNLQRNAVALLLYPPKYASRRQRFVVNNSPGPEKPLVRCFFIYNQQSSAGIGGIRTSGNRGLACVLFEVHLNDYKNKIDTMSNYPTDPSLFESRVRPSLFVGDDPPKSNAHVKAYTKIHVWRRGRVNMEALQAKLTVIISNTLWDVSVEQFLKEQPIAIESDQQPPACHLNALYAQHLARWIAFGARTSAPLARHSRIQHRISVDHVLREFKTHLSWTGTSTSNGSTLSVRYFYAERTPYGQAKPFSSNLVAGLLDPLQLDDTCADTVLSDNLTFHEWQPSAAADTVNATCVLVLVSVATLANSNGEQENHQHRSVRPIKRSDSDTDNGLVVVEDEENAEDNEDEVTDSDKEDNTKTITNVNQLVAINIGTHEEAKKNNGTSNNNNNDNGRIINRQKLSRLLLLAVSGRALHTLTYNWNNGGDDNSTGVRRLCGWLEWRRAVFSSAVLYKLGLINPRAYNATLSSHSAAVKNNVDLLLDYKGYAAAMGDHHEYGERIGADKVTRTSGRVKHNDTDTEDKKIKSNVYEKDVQDLYLERSVRVYKQQRRLDLHRKCLYDMWTHSEERVISKETLWTFYRHSRLLHYCLTPLLFLPRWRLESAATRDHSLDAYKTRTTEPPPLWHRKLCARFSQAYAEYIETHPAVTGFQLVQIGKQQHTAGHHHAVNDSTGNETDISKATTCYLKKSVPGINGGLLLIETGVSQPFYYVKMCCVERARLANNSDEPDDDEENQQQYTLLDQSERIVHNMHLHSFTYDFHVRILTDRLGKLIKNVNNNRFVVVVGPGKQQSQPQQTSSALNKSAAHQSNNASRSAHVPKINAVSGFLDDFLRYYNQPPTYSRCLVQSNIFRRTQMPVTGRQLYEYLLANSNAGEGSDGMSVIKISGYVMGEGDNGKSLFDDDGDNDSSVADDNVHNRSSDNGLPTGVDLTDYVLVHRMSNDMLHLKKCPSSEFDSHLGGSESDLHESRSDCGFENCNLYDATLVLSLSSKHCSGLDGSRDVPPTDGSNEIALSYYVLLTVDENVDLENRNATHMDRTGHQRHSTPIQKLHDQLSNVTVSTSVPCGSYSYTMASDSATCWGGSLDEINSNVWCPTPPNTRQRWSSPNQNDHLYNHHKYKVLKDHLTCCYGQRAAELVAQTVDTAASRCRVHMLWRTFSLQSDQQKSGLSVLSFDELEELVTKAGLIEPLAVYDPRIGPLLEQLSVGPQWFGSLHKLLVSTSQSPRLTTRCRLYSSYNAEHQYLVVLPAAATDNVDQVDVFVLISNKSVRRSGQPINIVYRKACNNSTSSLENIVEAVGRAVCYFVWRAAMSATANVTPSVPSNSSQQ